MKVRVIVVRVGLMPEVRELEEGETLAAMQEVVGGYVECIELGDGVDLWSNESALLLDLPINRVIPTVAPEVPEGWDFVVREDGLAEPGQPGEWRIHGDFLLARHDRQGRTTSLTDADVRFWMYRFAVETILGR